MYESFDNGSLCGMAHSVVWWRAVILEVRKTDGQAVVSDTVEEKHPDMSADNDHPSTARWLFIIYKKEEQLRLRCTGHHTPENQQPLAVCHQCAAAVWKT